jgi:hypothetical protein
MKKYNISIDGYGCEMTIGRLTDEQANFISESEAEDLYDIIYDDQLGGHWAEIDDVYHNFGCGDSGQITVSDENGNYIYQVEIDELYGEDNIECEDKSFMQEEGVKYLACCSHEKGNFFSTEIELEEDFDPSKLKIFIHEDVGLDKCYVYGDMIGKVTYDGEELDNWGGDTMGKSFDVKINF